MNAVDGQRENALLLGDAFVDDVAGDFVFVVVVVADGVVDLAKQQVVGARDLFRLLPGAIEQNHMPNAGARPVDQWLTAQKVRVTNDMRVFSSLSGHSSAPPLFLLEEAMLTSCLQTRKNKAVFSSL